MELGIRSQRDENEEQQVREVRCGEHDHPLYRPRHAADERQKQHQRERAGQRHPARQGRRATGYGARIETGRQHAGHPEQGPQGQQECVHGLCHLQRIGPCTQRTRPEADDDRSHAVHGPADRSGEEARAQHDARRSRVGWCEEPRYGPVAECVEGNPEHSQVVPDDQAAPRPTGRALARLRNRRQQQHIPRTGDHRSQCRADRQRPNLWSGPGRIGIASAHAQIRLGHAASRVQNGVL